uniref:Uncharacterized protein n=1 Tax=Corethron hystrix TaxID=216773 RepID=A0A7S1BQP6_9STRA|mmetsp:Transcript_35204/g.81430  ORF Transcript_35204/g.81430 Transcript_35204/m.81430 type:complete len:213 (+) Transcript_35204:519-1157(+)
MCPSSKLEAILLELKEVWTLNPNSLVLVHSGCEEFLILIEKYLAKSKTLCQRLRWDNAWMTLPGGRADCCRRAAVLKELLCDPGGGNSRTEVANIALLRGGVVLTYGNRSYAFELDYIRSHIAAIFIVHPEIFEGTEDGDLNIVHQVRSLDPLSLTAPIQIRRFVVNNSVEERILNVATKWSKKMLPNTHAVNEKKCRTTTLEIVKLLVDSA